MLGWVNFCMNYPDYPVMAILAQPMTNLSYQTDSEYIFQYFCTFKHSVLFHKMHAICATYIKQPYGAQYWYSLSPSAFTADVQ